MIKLIFMLIVGLSLHARNVYIVTDLSNGITKPIYQELGLLTQPTPDSDDDIYKQDDHVLLYAYRSTQKYSSEFVYFPRAKKESAWKKSYMRHHGFFDNVKKSGVKKRASIRSNIIFLVDTSGSMKKNGIMEQVKTTMRYLVNAKSKKSHIAIVTFDGKSRMKADKRSKVVSNFTNQKSALLNTIDAIHPSANDTYLGSGLQKVQHLLSRAKPKNTLVLVFTDGKEINDKKSALKQVQNFKNRHVNLKVVAVGGADVEMLKEFSTTGYVFNATSSDLQDMMQKISFNSNPIFLQLNDMLENNTPLKKGDVLLIYSSMMNVDSSSDFFIVPNVASNDFYRELEAVNKKRGIALALNGVDVYVRVTGEIEAEKLNQLRLLYKRYFHEHGATLKYFSNANLSKAKF